MGLQPRRSILAAAFIVALCISVAAASGAAPESPDTIGDVGEASSLALDGAGNPVVSYRDTTNQDLKLLHCNDPDCAGGDDSIESPDTTGFVGAYSSLELDAAGNPVVSYLGGDVDLKVLHCNDPDCAGGDDSIESPDTSGNVGYYTSLELDGAGNPVVSYYDATNGDLKVLHCNDPNCSPGGDTVERADVVGNVGSHTSLELDGAGKPVISYHDVTNGDLKVVHCDIASCADGQISFSPDTGGTVGSYTSLELDGAGNPVVSYYDATNGDLKVRRCDDPACESGGTTELVDVTGTVGLWTSLELDGAGKPVISYLDGTSSALKVVHCDIASCADGQVSEIADNAGDVGSWSSLALDALGNPVISYYDATNDLNGDLKVLHCDNPTCDADLDDDGVPDEIDSDGGAGSGAAGISDLIAGQPATTATVSSGSVTVADVADPDGVSVTAGPAGAVLSPVCGASVSLGIPVGASLTLTCHSIEIRDVDVSGDPVTVTLSGGAVVTFPDGTSGTVDSTPSGGVVVTGVSGDGVTLAVGGSTAPVTEGGSLNLIVGSAGSNTLDGTAGDDLIVGNGGNDTIRGNGGNDTIVTGAGNDKIDGGAGDDTIDAGNGNNTVEGGADDDEIVTGAGNDKIDGGAGNDTIDAGNGNNTVGGGADDDEIVTGAGNDKIDGGSGVDTCQSGGGHDTVKNCEA